MLRLSTTLRLSITIIGFVLLATMSTGLNAQQSVSVGATDIGGVVTSSTGLEAGVWVIAETTELPTKYAKIPDLPKANYSVWVRGYGLGWILPKCAPSRACISILRRCRRRTRPQRRITIRRSIGIQ